VVTVVAPLVVVAALAASASAAALHVKAALFDVGPWAWLGDAALVLDVCGGVALLGVPAAVRREQAARSGIGDVDAMSGREFEERLALLFADLGYAVVRTRASGDYGADLLLERAGERVVVQAKRYDASVGIEAVQQVIGATRYYDAAQALVVTNSTCTKPAAALANAHGVELVEREALVGLLAAHPRAVDRSPAVLLLAREFGSGVALALFAAGAVLRVAWWTSRAALRLSAALWRAVH
jgi:HJR/Mrr/RecB family endonuclease